MKKIFVAAIIIGSILAAGCQAPENQPATSGTPAKNAETTSKVSITINPSPEIPAPATAATSATTQSATSQSASAESAPTGSASTTQPAAWTVEQSSAGAEDQSYLDIYFVALNDNGQSGPAVGCGDSLVSVKVKYGLAKDESTVKDTLAKLFAVKSQYYAGTGLYNSLYQSDLKVDSLTVDAAKKATLKLSGKMTLGGVCDNPRVEAQIRETVMQFKNLYSSVDILVNDKPLKDVLSEK